MHSNADCVYVPFVYVYVPDVFVYVPREFVCLVLVCVWRVAGFSASGEQSTCVAFDFNKTLVFVFIRIYTHTRRSIHIHSQVEIHNMYISYLN
jgi:hypothetical protein